MRLYTYFAYVLVCVEILGDVVVAFRCRSDGVRWYSEIEWILAAEVSAGWPALSFVPKIEINVITKTNSDKKNTH